MIVADPENPDSKTPPTSEDMWCYMQHVLSLQEDFQIERPLVQSLIEDVGHICLFLPQFHCELNLEFKGPVRSSFSPKLGLTETEVGPRLMPNLRNLDQTQEDWSIPV